jgi:hypothetical protein
MALRRFAIAALAFAALPAAGQIRLRTPVPLISPTPTPGFQPKDPGAFGPKELPPTPTTAPTRTSTPTSTPTPAPPDQRFAGPRWGQDQFLLPVALTRLDAHSQCKTSSDFFNSGMFFASIDCYAQGRGPLGLKADVEVAQGLRLKNGWKVKSVDINFWDGTQPLNVDKHHGFDVRKKPAIGSDDPSVSLHLFCEPNYGIVVRGGVLIEGPHGTTPW